MVFFTYMLSAEKERTDKMGMKEVIKESKLYHRLRIAKIRRNPKKYANQCFFWAYNKNIDWNNPVWFDEKLNVLKCGEYYKNPLIIQCADKYRVREYVKSKGLEDILNGLYGVWDNASDIAIDNLPNKFVIKRNNDAGGVLVVSDKTKEEALADKIKQLGLGTTRDYGLLFAEYHYQFIEPCYIAEAYLGTEDGSFPYDYKFYCMNGKARAALICRGRENNEVNLERFVVDENFDLIPMMKGEKEFTNEEIQCYKPENWDEMLQVAEKLAEDFPFVRVDLYDVDGRVVFGELTFTPMGSRNTYFTEEGQKLFGDWLSI